MQRSRFSDCRVCGERKTNEEMLTHELDCLQASQDELKTQNIPDDNNNYANVNQVGSSRNQQPRLEDDIATENDDSNQRSARRVFSSKDQQLEDDKTIAEDNNPENLEPETDIVPQPRFSDCQACGVRKTNEAMLRHELDCLQASQDELNMESSPDGNNNYVKVHKVRRSRNRQPKYEEEITIVEDNNNPANLETDRPSRHKPTRLPDKISDPPDEDQGSNDDFSTSSAFPTPEISEVDENEDDESESSISDQSDSSISDQSSSAIPMGQISDSWDDEDEDSEKQSTTDTKSSPKRKTKKKSENKKNSLVTETFRYDRKKPKNLFPPTKKYRYYPVTCDFCRERFQPNELKAHQKKYHLKEPEDVKLRKRAQSTATRKGFVSEKSPAASSKSTGKMMGRFEFCYICGQMYGSKSIKIHEPQCLKKWRIRNNKLPPEQRAPEPVKAKPLVSSDEIVGGETEYKVPEYDPAVEAAFERHLSSLIPCKHCSRKFSPDRIQYHTSCCIERPRSRTRDCVTPKGGEIPR